MPPKIRELISELQRAGFADRGGKGSHRNFVHPKVTKPITISGAPGDDARYTKIVEWSEEDQCYVGSSPGLIYGGCHGPDEKVVFEELCQVVEEAIALYHRDGKPLPPPTSGRDFANKMQNVA